MQKRTARILIVVSAIIVFLGISVLWMEEIVRTLGWSASADVSAVCKMVAAFAAVLISSSVAFMCTRERQQTQMSEGGGE